jgi:hypothetical protein
MTVNESAPPHPSQPPKPSGWGRVWTKAKVAGPALTATVALVISLLALVEQRTADQNQERANAATEAASQRQTASQVSFLQEGDNATPSVLVVNLGSTPVYNALINITLYTTDTKNKNVTHALFAWVGTIPACSSGTGHFDPFLQDDLDQAIALNRAVFPEIHMDSMTFTESNGLDWKYYDGGRPLREMKSGRQIASNPTGFLKMTYKSATSCS